MSDGDKFWYTVQQRADECERKGWLHSPSHEITSRGRRGVYSCVHCSVCR
jgi:hypothetical protein